MRPRQIERRLVAVRRPFFLALLLLVGVYVVSPLFPVADLVADETAGWGATVGGLLLWVGLATGLALATHASRSRRRITGAVVPLIALLTVLGVFMDPGPGASTTIQRGLFAVLVVISTFSVLEFVIRAERVDADAIFASMCAYFLLAVLWAFLYATAESALALGGEPVFRPEPAEDAATGFRSLLYFSFVTLTTVGYGDMTPIHPFVRALATMEALVGQMFVAILVARLVSLEILTRSARATGD